MIDAFSLATAALAFGSKFFADDRPPTNTKGQMGRKQTSSSFLDFDFTTIIALTNSIHSGPDRSSVAVVGNSFVSNFQLPCK